jgi:hypothetical protein
MKKFISLYDSADFTTLPIFSLPDTKCSMTFKCGQREMVLSQALSVRQVRLLIPRFSLCSFGRLHNLPAGEGVMSDFINVSLPLKYQSSPFQISTPTYLQAIREDTSLQVTAKDTYLHKKQNHPRLQHTYEDTPNPISSARTSALDGKNECFASLEYFQNNFTVSHLESHVSIVYRSL